MAEDDTKRRIRKLNTNTETVRQRTEKLQLKSNDSQKPGILRSFWRGFSWPIRQIAKPFAKFGRFLGRYRVFRIIGKIIFPVYFRNSWRELRQVAWPDRSTSWRLTYAVIVFSVIFGSLVALVDFGLDKLFKELIIK